MRLLAIDRPAQIGIGWQCFMSNTAHMNTLQITSRDVEIIRTVYRYDGMFSFQIRRRFWGQNGHPRTYLDRLAELLVAGYLRAVPVPSGTRGGSGQRLIVIGRAAHALLAELEGLTHSEITRLRHAIVPALWQHELAVRDVRLSVDLACADHPGVDLVEWVTDAEYHRTPIKLRVRNPDPPGRPLAVDLVPDGSFTLELSSGQSKTYFLEVDRDTEQTPSKIKGRLRAYLQHVGVTQRPVLWVVPSVRRAEKLTRWINEAAASLSCSPAIFAITTSDQVDERRVLTHPIWQVVGASSPMSLLPSPGVPQDMSQPANEPWYLKLDREPAQAA